ncbi:hypothetical protein RIF29_27706 [Crotalaria pallida]|uniref:Dof zinc finger protein n=1 Tax=Crotalaria pallida TaxID=3830 RepID=A0AAN9I0P7_CROPI
MSRQSSFENMLVSPNSQQQQQERKPTRPQPEQALKCPRCDSTNTKFCYYNNYSLSQPRYFCKSCRRYWTKGGTLRNVPVGGGCRKAKRSSPSSSSSKRAQDQTFTPNQNPLINTFPHLFYDSSDLTMLQKQTCGGQLGFDDHDLSILGNPTSSLCDILGNNQGMNPSTTNHGFLNALRSGFLGTHQNYYVYGNNGDMGEVVDNNGNANNSCGVGGEMMLPNYDHGISNVATQAVRASGMKQEQCESKVMGDFPWQLNGDTNIGELDLGRGNWNGFTPSWHGLLHSPLM